MKLFRVCRIQSFRAVGWFRSKAAKLEIERMGGSVGTNFRLRRHARVTLARGARISIGDDFDLAEGAELFVQPGAAMAIGHGVFVGKGTVISASESVHIGDGSQIAHLVTIIDSDHRVSAEKSLKNSGFVTAPVTIGKNCWIGANAVVLKGVAIGDGSVVGAGAVVTKPGPKRHVATGNPAAWRAIDK